MEELEPLSLTATQHRLGTINSELEQTEAIDASANPLFGTANPTGGPLQGAPDSVVEFFTDILGVIEADRVFRTPIGPYLQLQAECRSRNRQRPTIKSTGGR